MRQRFQTPPSEQNPTASRPERGKRNSAIAKIFLCVRIITALWIVSFLLSVLNAKKGEKEQDVTKKSTDSDATAARTPMEHVTIKSTILDTAAERASMEFIPLSKTYGPSVEACRLTAVVMDPQLYTHSVDHSIWKALESFAEVMKTEEKTCLVLLTSDCVAKKKIQETPPEGNLQLSNDNALEEKSRLAVVERVLKHVQPEFRKMIENGYVRLAILNNEKYRYSDCVKWKTSPMNTMVNAQFYRDEFIEGVDSDHILFFNSNALFCRTLRIDDWKDFAWVGSPWTQGAHYITQQWLNYAKINKTFVKYWDNGDGTEGNTTVKFAPLPQPVTMNGNDRLTLVNRQWILRVINTCPQRKISGLPDSIFVGKNCTASGRPEADIYFPTVLRGIGAPMPSNFEAGLFSAKDIWAEDVAERDGWSQDQMDTAVRNRWGDKGSESFDRKEFQGKYAVPISVHRKETKIGECPKMGLSSLTDLIP